MSRLPNALLRGRVTIRPWRVGLLVDVDNEAEVREAIAAMTSVWGGIYLPILDRNTSIPGLRRAAEEFDLDSLYAAEAEGDLEELLRLPGYRWNGRADWGPFSRSRGSMRTGLILAESLQPDGQEVPWSGPNEGELIVHAHLGYGGSSESPPRPIAATTRYLRLANRYRDRGLRGLCVVRPATPRDIVWFWNCRARSGEAYPMAAEWPEFNQSILHEIETMRLLQAPHPEEGKPAPKTLYVWGIEDLGIAERKVLDSWADHLEVEIKAWEREAAGHQLGPFPGFDHEVSAPFRVEPMTTAHGIHVHVPKLPLKHNGNFQGVVAAEVDFHEASRLDPRLSAAIAPHRRHSKLLELSLSREADHVRASPVGPVFGIQSHADEVFVPMVYNIENIGLLFDEDDWRFSQSNDGHFQTRAAEMFGGALSGALAQPGLRAAIHSVAGREIGVVWDQIWRAVTDNRGEWPDQIFGASLTPNDYGKRLAQQLLNTGLLIPTLDVECSHCRVVSRVSPNDLGTIIQCEFCGEESKLALSLTLSKPTWRYRLAAHLPVEKISAFLPVMAAASVLASLFHIEGPQASHVLGLEVTRPGCKPMEVDVAMVLHEAQWTVVLGEVKSHYPIDANDIENLFSLQRALAAKNVRCITLFATLKESFSADEREFLRSAVEREKSTVSHGYQRLPLMPLLLTERDMSLPNHHEDHPWRWGAPAEGIFGTAIESCKRNLGLVSATFGAENRHSPIYEWSDVH